MKVCTERESSIFNPAPRAPIWSFEVCLRECLLDLGEDFEALARSKGEVRIRVEGFMKELWTRNESCLCKLGGGSLEYK